MRQVGPWNSLAGSCQIAEPHIQRESLSQGGRWTQVHTHTYTHVHVRKTTDQNSWNLDSDNKLYPVPSPIPILSKWSPFPLLRHKGSLSHPQPAACPLWWRERAHSFLYHLSSRPYHGPPLCLWIKEVSPPLCLISLVLARWHGHYVSINKRYVPTTQSRF